MNMQATKIQSYRDLKIWQKSVELATQVYALTESFPSSEIYGIISQMRRAAISIPSNIAEGSRRGTKKDYCHFLLIAFGSGSELETFYQLLTTTYELMKHSMKIKTYTLLAL